MRQSWQWEGGPALRWWRLPVMKRSVAAGRSRWAVGDEVGSFFSSTSSVSLLNWVIRVLLWPMLPHCWNSGGGDNNLAAMSWEGPQCTSWVSAMHTSTAVKRSEEQSFLIWVSVSSNGRLSLCWPWDKVATCPQCRVIVRGWGYRVRWQGQAAAPWRPWVLLEKRW